MLFIIGLSTTDSLAANITVAREGSATKAAIIFIEGGFIDGDDKTFAQIALTIETAVVVMSSDGGNLRAGIQIGKAIRLKQFDTLVLANYSCASACALAWLGGTRRMMEPGSQIGFHAAYREQNGKLEESGVGNALAGSYLNQLGLPERAVTYITSTAPESIQWLTLDDARNTGIDVIPFNSGDVATKPETLQSSRDYTVSDGTDLFGLDLPNMPIKNMAMNRCQKACDDTAQCQAFTFNRKSSTCFLKSGATLSVGYEYAVAGYLPSITDKIKRSEIRIRQRTDVVGSDYRHDDGISLEQCIRECDESLLCRAFTFIAKRRQCWLKSAQGTQVHKRGVISGLK